MKYDEVGRQIHDAVGGADNISSFTNCMTRLRVSVHDTDKVDVEHLKELDGVMGVVPGSQTQIVVGPGHAERLRQAFAKVSGIEPDPEVDDDTDAADRDVAAETKAAVKSHQTTGIHAMFRHIGNIFVPIIPGFIACGLVLAIANIWKLADPAIAENAWYLAFAGIGGIVVGGLNFLVGMNTAKEFGGTPVLGFIAGGVPFLEQMAGVVETAPDGSEIPIQQLSVPLFGTLSPGLGGVIGVIVTAWIFTVIEKKLRTFVPAVLDLFVVPIVTVLAGSLLCVFVIMPISALVMKGLTWLLVDFALQQGGIIGGFLMASLFLPMVMLGVHQGLTPVHAELITQHGFTMLLPILAMAGAGQVGMAIGVYLRTRNDKLRKVIRGAFPVGVLGIGEPLIYGVSLPLVYPFITACLGAGFGGAFVAFGIQQGGDFGAQALGLSGVLMVPVLSAGGWMWYLGGWLISVVMGFVLTYMFGFKEKMADRIM